MVIKKHGSFYIRNGWPTKIISSVNNDTHIFSPNMEMNAVDILGVGRVMVKAMRYWAKVLGLTDEGYDQQGVVTTPTALLEQISQHDLYFQSIGTLWLLHRNLSRDLDNATAWYWAFNVYNKPLFSKSDFSNDFHAYLVNAGASYNRSAVEQEFDCFKNTYVSDEKFDIKKIVEEDTAPFFAPLRLISYAGNGMFEKNSPSAKDIPSDIFLYCILLDNAELLENSTQISIEQLLRDKGQVGRYMNLSYSMLLELLQQLENVEYIRLYNNFGNRHIELRENNAQNILNQYFEQIEG